MEFSLEGYGALLGLLNSKQYEVADYHDWVNKEKCVILRHDVDNDLAAALDMAQLENEKGVKSTYFVLLTSDFYNPFSNRSKSILNEIERLGHEIGLHFDETRYEGQSLTSLADLMIKEASILSDLTDFPVSTVSMHRPSRGMLDADLKVPGMVNSYGKTFFNDFKYLSDSRMHWREPVEEIIIEKNYPRLHILTHAFWYKGKDMRSTISDFVLRATRDRYDTLRDNLTDVEKVVSFLDILRKKGER